MKNLFACCANKKGLKYDVMSLQTSFCSIALFYKRINIFEQGYMMYAFLLRSAISYL